MKNNYEIECLSLMRACWPQSLETVVGGCWGTKPHESQRRDRIYAIFSTWDFSCWPFLTKVSSCTEDLKKKGNAPLQGMLLSNFNCDLFKSFCSHRGLLS